jgi:mannose-6-phosphate isomerase-like protein (cupin superfamily)
MTVIQKKKSSAAVNTGTSSLQTKSTGRKKILPTEKTGITVATPSRSIKNAASSRTVKTGGRTSSEEGKTRARSAGTPGKKATFHTTDVSVPASPGDAKRTKNGVHSTDTDREKSGAQALHAAAKRNAQIEKNAAKVASHELHTYPPVISHPDSMKTGSHRYQTNKEKAAAHHLHDMAKRDAQIEKNTTKVTSHDVHKLPGKEAHAVSLDEKAIALKAFSRDAKVAAHHPHTHTVPGTVASHEKNVVHKEGKNGFVADLDEETKKNRDFRRVLYTGKNCQLVLMCLKPNEDIGMEVHENVDQFFRFEEGKGTVEIDGKLHMVTDGSGVIVPCGAMHNVTNTSGTALLKLYTIYSPPEHQDKVVRKTKREALSDEEHFNGKTTEKYIPANAHSLPVHR